VGSKPTDSTGSLFFQQNANQNDRHHRYNKIKLSTAKGDLHPDHGLAYCLVAFDVSISQIIDTAMGFLYVCREPTFDSPWVVARVFLLSGVEARIAENAVVTCKLLP